MKTTFKLFLSCLVLSLMSSTCNKLKSTDFIANATQQSTYGGAYGSGSSKIYNITFTNLVTDTFKIDTIYFSIDAAECYRKLGNDNGISLYQNENQLFQLNCSYQEGERMQANGEIKDVITPKYPKPSRMGNNEGMIMGTYKGKYYEILIPEIVKAESISYP